MVRYVAQCEDDEAWVCTAGFCHDLVELAEEAGGTGAGCDMLHESLMSLFGMRYLVNAGSELCDHVANADGVTASQACSVTCSGGDITACPAYDNCWDSPCLNGGACTDGLGTFTCACPAHYRGPACETYSGPNQDIVRVCG